MFEVYLNDETNDQIVVSLKDFAREYNDYEEYDEWYNQATKYINSFNNYEGYVVESPQKHLYFISLGSWDIMIRDKEEDKKTLEHIENCLIDKFDDLETEIENYIDDYYSNEDDEY